MRFTASLAFLSLLVAGCAGGTNAPPETGVTFPDVHGLAVDPNDSRVLYVATHNGLYRGVDGKDWSKVGTETMDLMGFTMHPTDANVVYASGHPARPSRDYSMLGVIKSIDGGVTWTTVALRNEVDFHAMTISLAEPSKVWGYYYRDGRFYESPDSGAIWNQFAPTKAAPQINSIASHATNATTVYAGTNDGVWTSTDTGRTWSKLSGSQPPGAAGAVATTKANADLVWAFFPSVGISRSEDAGGSWNTAASIPWGSQDGPAVIALDPSRPETVYVASGRGAIFQANDNGATWTQIQRAA